MRKTLIKTTPRRNPFKVLQIPLLARIYGYPANTWPTSRGRQILFGAPFLAAYSVLRHIKPFPATGRFELLAKDQPVEIEFDARNTQFQALYLNAFINGYEPELTALFDILVGDSDTFWDIGSNWGFFSLFVASKPGFRGKVCAFEPFPSTFRDLANVVRQSGLQSQIQCNNVALSNFEGKAPMRLPDHTHSGLATIDTAGNGGPNQTQVKTLDCLNLDADVIKIDAEGSEGAILEGAQQFLKRQKPTLVIENWRNFLDMNQTLYPLRLLEDLGYALYHPCWLRKDNGREFLFSAESSSASAALDSVALVPMSPEDRFLRYDQINVLACHKDKVPELETVFETRETV